MKAIYNNFLKQFQRKAGSNQQILELNKTVCTSRQNSETFDFTVLPIKELFHEKMIKQLNLF